MQASKAAYRHFGKKCYTVIMKVTVLTEDKQIDLSTDKQISLLSLLRQHGIPVNAECGGRGVCNKCRVRLVQGQTDAPIADGSFNACKHTLDGDITIAVDAQQSQGFAEILYNFDNKQADGGQSDVQFDMQSDGHSQGQYGYIQPDGGQPDSGQPNGGQGINSLSRTEYGIAVDIGTTTVAAYLIELQSGRLSDSCGELNRQIGFGADVLSRISASRDNLDLLHNTILSQINAIKEMFCVRHNIKNISKAIYCGNTTMLHLLCNVSPISMGASPFVPQFTQSRQCCGGVTLPSASAYIGSDIVAGVLSSGMLENSGNSLLLDLGTNGEIVLKYKGEYYACATAAGPAIEGGNIEKGMGGINGAIDRIWLGQNGLEYSTVRGSAKGICGAGLVDLIALLVQDGTIDSTGFLRDNGGALGKRIKDGRIFITDRVYVSQKDIRQFQLAKSAIYSGIQVLLDTARCTLDDIDTIYLAGGIGYYINKHNAAIAGLLPQTGVSKTISIGNAAGKGAVMCITDAANINLCTGIANSIKVIELQGEQFYKLFVSNMSFLQNT